MPIIQDNIRPDVLAFLQDMRDPVTVDFYPHPQNPATEPMLDLLRELHGMAPAIHVIEHENSQTLAGPDNEEAIEGPVTTLSVGDQFSGIRYLGFPGGQEFTTFLEDLVDLSSGHALTLSTATQEWLKGLDKPLHLEVFVTPT